MKKQTVLALVLILGCTTANQQAPAARQSEHKNLQVLPKDIPHDELIATMRGFTRALGVKCDHCHVVTATEPRQVLDFPNDAKETKRAARVMLRMVGDINGKWIPQVEPDAAKRPVVGCWTCHRGHDEPEAPPPPPPPAPRPGLRGSALGL